MKENIFGKTLKGEIKAEIIFTREALWGCSDWSIIPAVAADIVPDAADYVLKKVLHERFTIVSEELKTVITGIVLYKDDEEIELLITNVYGDIHIVKKDHFKVD